MESTFQNRFSSASENLVCCTYEMRISFAVLLRMALAFDTLLWPLTPYLCYTFADTLLLLHFCYTFAPYFCTLLLHSTFTFETFVVLLRIALAFGTPWAPQTSQVWVYRALPSRQSPHSTWPHGKLWGCLQNRRWKIINTKDR